MDRFLMRYGYPATLLALLAVVVPAGGCSAMAALAYVTGGNRIKAQFTGLEEKKVAVVCRPMIDLSYRSSSAARQLAGQLGRLLQEKVYKIQVIDQAKVAQYTDEHMWGDYAEVGKALDAELVVGVDLHELTIYKDETLYQGEAKATVRVYDCTNGGRLVFERALPETLYPPNSAVPTSDKPRADFQQEFIHVLADQLGRYFYDHDPYADYAVDVAAME